jgi:hypothetical protein
MTELTCPTQPPPQRLAHSATADTKKSRCAVPFSPSADAAAVNAPPERPESGVSPGRSAPRSSSAPATPE